MDLIRSFFKKGFKDAKTKVSEPEFATVEEIIIHLRQNFVSRALCWIVCYENRPLQGRPPGSSKFHLLIFSNPAHANAFISGRRQFFTPEPLSVVSVNTPALLKKLATTPAIDSRYEQPPCGLLLNFTYPRGATDKIISPSEVISMTPDQLAKALGVA